MKKFSQSQKFITNILLSESKSSSFYFIAFLLSYANGCGQTANFSGNSTKSHPLIITTSQRYPAIKNMKNNVDYNFTEDTLSQDLKLEALPPIQKTISQISRTQVSEVLTQGSKGQVQTDVFSVKTPDKLDLLVIVDNSSSMAPYQERLSKGLIPLLSHLANTDWHLMVVTTTPVKKYSPPSGEIKLYGCPRLNPLDPTDSTLITKDDYTRNPNATQARFKWKILAGERGDPIERGLLAAVSGLRGECGDPQKSWLRPEAHKAVLILTDEENCGSDEDQNCDGDQDADPNFFLRQAPKGAQFFALLHDKDKYQTCSDEGYVRKPEDYRFVISKTGGMEGSICDSNYEATLTEISRNIHPVAKSEFFLSSNPTPGSITIKADGQLVQVSYEIQNNTLLFTTPLSSQYDILEVNYRHGATPIFSEINLKNTYDPDTIKVEVNNNPLDNENFTVRGAGSAFEQKITFAEIPGDNSKIKVSGRSLETLPSTFIIGKDLTPRFMQVFVNGKGIDDFTYNGATGQLSLPTAPPDESNIRVSYETPESRKTKYLVTLPEGVLIDETIVYDPATQQNITPTLENNQITLPLDEIIQDRKLVVQFKVSSLESEFRLNLPQTPIEDSVNFTSSKADSHCLNSRLITKNEITFPCSRRELGDIGVSYIYQTELQNTFDLPGKYESNSHYYVNIDHQPNNSFKIEQSKIVINPEAILKTSEIEIIQQTYIGE